MTMTSENVVTPHLQDAGQGSRDLAHVKESLAEMNARARDVAETAVEFTHEQVVNCALTDKPQENADRIAKANAAAEFAGIMALATGTKAWALRQLQELEERLAFLNQQGRSDDGRHVECASLRDPALAPTFAEHLGVFVLKTIAWVGLCGAVLNVAYAMKALNPVLYDTPLWKLMLAASPLLLAGKLGSAAALVRLEPNAIRGMFHRCAVLTTFTALIWLAALAAEMTLARSSGRSAGLDPKSVLAGLRLFSQVSVELSGSCAASLAAFLVELRGRKLIRRTSPWYELSDRDAERVATLGKLIAACDEVIEAINARSEAAAVLARNQVDAVSGQARAAADAAFRAAIYASPRPQPQAERQFRLI